MGKIKNFLRNEDGNYAVIFALAALPIFGAVGVSVDYSNYSRLDYNLKDAVDSMCTVTAQQFLEGKDDATAKGSGDKYFKANIDPEFAATATTTYVMPTDSGNTAKTLTCKGQLTYKPIFGPLMAYLTKSSEDKYLVVVNESTMRMRSLAEISLVLDNSGSMLQDKTGVTTTDTTKQRLTLLKAASKKLVSDMIDVGAKIQTGTDAIKFSIVPFAGSVNVGAENANASWMDTTGLNPTHHENLNWGTKSDPAPTGYKNPTGYYADDGNRKKDKDGNYLTRFSILNALKIATNGTADTSKCRVWKSGATSNGTGNSNCRIFHRNSTTVTPVTSSSAAASSALNTPVAVLEAKYKWGGCVESRPDGLDITDAVPSGGIGNTLFVPMFAPDAMNVSRYGSSAVTGGYNNWWPDYETNQVNGFWPTAIDAGQLLTFSPTSSSWVSGNSRPREIDVAKYFAYKPYPAELAYSSNATGPNAGCTTAPILPLTASKTTLTTAIDDMVARGGTNMVEGLAWGWRTISSTAPFTQGQPETRKDIDRVVIMLTDGFNTYGFNNREFTEEQDYDAAKNKSLYGTWGVAGYTGNTGINGTATATTSTNKARIFQDAKDVDATIYSNENYTSAMDKKMQVLCTNIKGKNIILMTVSLDLNADNYTTQSDKDAVADAIANLKACAGLSKSKKEADGSPKKLYFSATSSNLDATFKEIADELSNLRFTQ